jgi:periplasmic divalent cation tolerance protein
MADEIIVLITTSSAEEAATIGTALVDEHIAACANIVPGIRSLFFWEGKTQDAREALMIVKSRLDLLDRIIFRVKDLHSYTVPEVIALPIVGGSAEYLRWLSDSTQAPR